MPVYHGIRPWDTVKCSACLATVHNAKFLQCSHSFCQPCVSQQLSRLTALLEAREKITIGCPQCREFFHSSLKDVKPRPSTAHGVGTVEYTTSSVRACTPRQKGGDARTTVDSRKKKRCESCADGGEYEEAGFWCQNCCDYLCFTCTQYHKSMKMSKGHIVKTIAWKERYGTVKSKVAETTRSQTARDPPKSKLLDSKSHSYKCEPCGLNKKSRDARYLCDTCQEGLCEDCSQCHRSMKMSKAHKLISMQDLLAKPESNLSLGLRCDKHKEEVLSLFCKRCQTSCCSICAVRLHSNCKPLTKPQASSVKQTITYDKGAEKIYSKVSFDSKAKDKKAPTKCVIPKNEMLRAKSRLVVCATTKGEWVISMAVLPTGDILAIELYSNELKLLSSSGKLISSCSFYGEPWSVAAHNHNLAAVTFSDRKQIQLVHIGMPGLQTGKFLNTRHKSLAICFCNNLIVTSCWEGCIHVMNIAGDELFSISKDNNGSPLFASPEYIASDKHGTVVYVSDFKRDSVTALSMLPNRFESKPKFVFKDAELRGPKGVTVDHQGVVYISGLTSRNMFRVSPDGQLIQSYRRRDDTDYYEDIGVTADGKQLLVSAYEDNTIIRFTFR